MQVGKGTGEVTGLEIEKISSPGLEIEKIRKVTRMGIGFIYLRSNFETFQTKF